MKQQARTSRLRTSDVTGSPWLCVVEFDVPVEIVAPAIGRVAEADRDADGRRRFGALRHPQQMHAGFCRRTPTFLAIARHAAGDDVLPVLAAALGDRHDMVEGQLTRWKAVAAILASVVVARVDVRARERHVVEAALDLDVAQQSDDRRQLETDGNAPD